MESIGFKDVINISDRCTLGRPLQRIEGEQRGREAAFNVGLFSDEADFRYKMGGRRVFAREKYGGACHFKSETLSIL
ncbi:MAG: hypothetical protein A2020_11935 [Lentisphaerae bacterium GWF2_45_14]|nr:MAG: hypothetical protein A2020_11935 [Lentisphaerae bacterium GWF2_45_14]